MIESISFSFMFFFLSLAFIMVTEKKIDKKNRTKNYLHKKN